MPDIDSTTTLDSQKTLQHALSQPEGIDYRQLTHVTTLTHFGVLEVTGPDAKTFLQGQLTCNILALPQTQTTLGAHCNIKGRAVATFWICHNPQPTEADSLLLILPRSNVPILHKTLGKYSVFSKVSLTDVSDQWTLTGIMTNPNTQTPPPDLTWPTQEQTCTFSNSNMLISLDTRFLLLSLNPLSPELSQHMDKYYRLENPALWTLADMDASIPILEAACSEAFIPIELNFDLNGGISFDKGCYTGQEIIARLHYRGQTKQRLQRVNLKPASNSISPMSTIMMSLDNQNSKPIGTLVQSVQVNTTNTGRGLAVVRQNLNLTTSTKLYLADNPSTEVLLLN